MCRGTGASSTRAHCAVGRGDPLRWLTCPLYGHDAHAQRWGRSQEPQILVNERGGATESLPRGHAGGAPRLACATALSGPQPRRTSL
eukprot:1572025-Pyramimonas_sp.AAC.1